MAKAVAEIKIKPIGYFRGHRTSKASVPRQGALSNQLGYIEFNKGFDHKLALTGLQDMSHLWILYYFHEAHSEPKPLVRPPRAPEIQVGVYATRSPYRPNKIGLTLAKIEKIEKAKLHLSHVDLLDQTPILDLKPYVKESDGVMNPQQGWIEKVQTWTYELSSVAEQQAQWLAHNGLSEIYDVLEAQLGTHPLQPQRKRIEPFNSEPNMWILSYRTWRFILHITESSRLSHILRIESGYTEKELNSYNSSDPIQGDPVQGDPHHDKELHRKFKMCVFQG